ncbi:MAG: signal peptide peptidase SppA [candidate division Zixibacteria bacterium]|nr:signal peptide peptidase SppA [candidate division Zixibacteria bacterium]
MSRRRDWTIGIIIGAAFLVFMFMTVAFFWGLSSTDGADFGGFGKKVAIVELKGTISASEEIVGQLRRFADDSSIPAIVLRIDSPGGGVAASQEIYDEIQRVKEKGKKVIVSMGSVAASGGLYVAVAADTIVANPGTLTGSIGVIFEFPTLEKLMEKVGVRYEVVKSGEYKDIGSIARSMTEKESAALQVVIDDTYDQFVEAVAKGRRLDKDSVKVFADGRIFTGRQAKEMKLVDELGDLHDALDIAAEMVGLESPPKTVKIIPRRRTGMLDFLGKTFIDWLTEYAGETANSAPALQYRYR